MKRAKLFFPLAAVLLSLGSFSCTREDDVNLKDTPNGSASPKESAIQKHIADHQKERTRSGALVTLEPVIYEGDTVM